ncbi:MAG: DUF6675 family protein [Treponema sp.]
MKNFILKTCLSFLLLSCFSPCFAKQYGAKLDRIFNSRLTEEEKKILLSGQVLIKNTKNYSNICLQSDSENAVKLMSEMKELRPNYLSEIIQIIPEESQPDIIAKINEVLSDIPSYKGIPYYSEHNKIWVDLYSEARIIEEKVSEEKSDFPNSENPASKKQKTIKADFFMEPFGDILSDIKIITSKDSLYYENINSDYIKYNSINCVSPQNMKSVIIVFKTEGYWVLYGIGGVNAPRIPFLTNRIELSFMNRIKTFCNFVFDKLK